MLRRPLVKAEVLTTEKPYTWIVTPFEKIKKGSIFRTYIDSEGTELSKDSKGNSVFLATSDARSENGFDYSIDCEPYYTEE